MGTNKRERKTQSQKDKHIASFQLQKHKITPRPTSSTSSNTTQPTEAAIFENLIAESRATVLRAKDVTKIEYIANDDSNSETQTEESEEEEHSEEESIVSLVLKMRAKVEGWPLRYLGFNARDQFSYHRVEASGGTSKSRDAVDVDVHFEPGATTRGFPMSAERSTLQRLGV